MRDAVVLAAGNGDRFRNTDHHSKLLHPLHGQPLIFRTLDTIAAAGITRIHVVVGYEADRVQSAITSHPLAGVAVHFVFNPDWPLENGVSALSAREICDADRFALLMGDHLFEPSALRRLASVRAAAEDSLLAVDVTETDPQIISEATRVRLDEDRIVAIGKGLEPWHALDTGMFIFTRELFAALEAAQSSGETTLSAGVQRLAECRLMRAVPLLDAAWCDVDTVADLAAAESTFGAPEPEHA